MALFDRIHNIRVKHIQEEYQKYMERVRSKAQSAIDLANSNYQTHRAMLTARVDAMVAYLQQQYLRVGQPPPSCSCVQHANLATVAPQGGSLRTLLLLFTVCEYGNSCTSGWALLLLCTACEYGNSAASQCVEVLLIPYMQSCI